MGLSHDGGALPQAKLDPPKLERPMAGVHHARKLHDAVMLHLVQRLRTVCHTSANRGPPKKHLPWTLLDPAARRT